MSLLILLALLNLSAIDAKSNCSVTTDTLCVNQVSEQGFGDLSNQYAWSMATFRDELYVATLNCLNSSDNLMLFVLGLPFPTKGTQIWRASVQHNTWSWQRVLNHGNGNINNFGVRKMVAVGEYLYGVTGNHVDGFEIWRTRDGTHWTVLMQHGFGNEDNTSGRGLAAFDGFLYVGCENRRSGANIWRRAITKLGDFVNNSDWEQVASDGLGDAMNYWFSDFVEFNGYLYVGTLNMLGMQLWRSKNGTHWENIFARGNGNTYNRAVMKLYVYDERLYVGTMNLVEGASLWVNVDDDATVFEAVFVDGFNDPWNVYVWYMQAFNERLYAGTLNDGTLHLRDEFDLFSSRDPLNETFVIETSNAFGYDGQYGIRNMAVFRDMLMIGTATSETELGCIIFAADALP